MEKLWISQIFALKMRKIGGQKVDKLWAKLGAPHFCGGASSVNLRGAEAKFCIFFLLRVRRGSGEATKSAETKKKKNAKSDSFFAG